MGDTWNCQNQCQNQCQSHNIVTCAALAENKIRGQPQQATSSILSFTYPTFSLVPELGKLYYGIERQTWGLYVNDCKFHSGLVFFGM